MRLEFKKADIVKFSLLAFYCVCLLTYFEKHRTSTLFLKCARSLTALTTRRASPAYEPRCEKTGFLRMRKQRRRTASRGVRLYDGPDLKLFIAFGWGCPERFPTRVLVYFRFSVVLLDLPGISNCQATR